MKITIDHKFVPIPTEAIDFLARYRLSGEEWKVLLVIWRKTYGYHKKSDWISLSQFSKYTDMKKPSVSRALKKIVSKKIVIKIVKGKRVFYQFSNNYSNWSALTKKLSNETRLSKKLKTINKKGKGSLAKKLTTIDRPTINKHTEDKLPHSSISGISINDLEEIATKYGVPISFVSSKYDDMINWHESTGKKRKNWFATLCGFVKKDAIKIRKEVNYGNAKRGIDATNL